MTLDTSSTNASSGSCISCQQEIQLPLGVVSCVQLFSAPNSFSQMLQVIAQYFHSLSGNKSKCWYRNNDWNDFFFPQRLCRFLPLKVASKTRTFQLCFCSHKTFITIVHWNRVLIYIPCQPHVPQLTPPQCDMLYSTQTDRQTDRHNLQNTKSEKNKTKQKPKLWTNTGWSLPKLTN